MPRYIIKPKNLNQISSEYLAFFIYLKNHPALQCSYTKIKLTADFQIHIDCSVQELNTTFPDFFRKLYNEGQFYDATNDRIFENSPDLIPDMIIEHQGLCHDLQEKLAKEHDESDLKRANQHTLPPKRTILSSFELTNTSLADESTICIGESHRSLAAKKLVISLIEQFSTEHNGHIIFLEHLMETMQDALDAYTSGDVAFMPVVLFNYLKHLDHVMGLEITKTRDATLIDDDLNTIPNSFTGIIIAAAKHRIRVIALESIESY